MRQFGGALQIELSFDLLAVILNRLDAQMQFLGYLAGLLPAPDELKDFHLAIAEVFDWRLVNVRLASDLLLQHFGPKVVADINGSAQHSANGSEHLSAAA